MIPPGDEDVIYPAEGDPESRDYSLRILIADEHGGWHWRNICIKAPHIFKIQFSEKRTVPGIEHSMFVDASHKCS